MAYHVVLHLNRCGWAETAEIQGDNTEEIAKVIRKLQKEKLIPRLKE